MSQFGYMQAAIQQAANAFNQFTVSANRVSVFMGGRLRKQVNDQYRERCGRLPGSDRTKRLRKKRVTAVNAWMFNSDRYVVR